MPAFQFPVNKRLRSLGLGENLAWAKLQNDARQQAMLQQDVLQQDVLQLTDELNHIFRIPMNDITRVRIGFVDAKYRTYSARIWFEPHDAPIELIALGNTWPAYRETMNDLVRLLAERGRLSRVETGSTKFDALLGPTLMAIPTVAAVAVSLFALTGEPWWGRVLVPLIPSVLLVILVRQARRRHWPRTLRDVGDLRVQLPPV